MFTMIIKMCLVITLGVHLSFCNQEREVVDVTIDGKSLKFTMSNDMEPEVDGVVEYLCGKGEIIDLTCKLRYDDGSLILRYYNANGTKVFETDEVNKKSDSLYFRLLMRTENSRSFIDCSYFTVAEHSNYRQNFTYRVIFIMRDPIVRNNYFTITVNDVKLISMPDKRNGAYMYIYKYIYGENITITCEKNDKTADSKIVWGVATTNGSMRIEIKDVQETKYLRQLSVQSNHLNGSRIQFSTKDNIINEFLTADIHFFLQPFSFLLDVAIVGLPRSDILYQYSKNNIEWISHYMYTPNETLLLTCITVTKYPLRWYKGNKMLTGLKNRDSKVGITYLTDLFALNGDNISCQLVKEELITMKLVFHEKPILPSLNLSEDRDKAFEDSSNMLVVVYSVVGVLAILIVAVFMFYRYRRRAQKIENGVANFFGNRNTIPEQRSQRGHDNYNENEYCYIKDQSYIMSSNSLYNGNVPDSRVKYRRNTTYSSSTENHYTEIDDHFAKESEGTEHTTSTTYDYALLYNNV